MTTLSSQISAMEPRRTAKTRAARTTAGRALGPHSWLATALCCSLTAGTLLPAQAQTSGALPFYRCVSADGTSSRVSRKPCAAGETSSVQHSVAAIPQQKPAIVQQAPGVAAQGQTQEDAHHRPHATHRAGKRR